MSTEAAEFNEYTQVLACAQCGRIESRERVFRDVVALRCECGCSSWMTMEVSMAQRWEDVCEHCEGRPTPRVCSHCRGTGKRGKKVEASAAPRVGPQLSLMPVVTPTYPALPDVLGLDRWAKLAALAAREQEREVALVQRGVDMLLAAAEAWVGTDAVRALVLQLGTQCQFCLSTTNKIVGAYNSWTMCGACHVILQRGQDSREGRSP